MIDGLAFSGNRYHENSERVTGDHWPCAICGRAVDTSRPRTAWIHVHNGGASIVTDAEAKALNDAGEESADMSWYPVGPECMKRHPELKPYAAIDDGKEPDGVLYVPGFGTGIS